MASRNVNDAARAFQLTIGGGPLEAPRRPPYGRWRRTIPLTATVVWLWLQWRWLRIKRHIFGVEAMEAATHR
ncbi:MAG: hypothetical protein R3F49_00020, partial [Planctomycetota bacterium]